MARPRYGLCDALQSHTERGREGPYTHLSRCLTRQQEMAGQANVLLAHLQSMGEPRIRAPAPYLMQAHGIGNIGGVPEDDRGDDEAAATPRRPLNSGRVRIAA